jgi:hypothetical protein
MSLPRSHSHNGPTNPKNKPQTIPKRKRNSKSKGLSSSALDQADCPQAPTDRPRDVGGLSASTGQSVCKAWVDCPRGCGGLCENNPRTSSTAPSITDRPCRHLGPSATNTLHADCPRTPDGPSAKPPATEDGRKIGSKERCLRTSDTHEGHQSSSLHADCPRPIGGLSAKHELLLPVHGSPKWLEHLRKDLGKI